jgi:hypothetical protein
MACHGPKRYANRQQLELGDNRVYGIYSVGGNPSVPCVVNVRTNYSLWIVDDSQSPYEFLEIGILRNPDNTRYWFTGCTICERFWGGPDDQHPLLGPYDGSMSFRIEKLPAFGGIGSCWKWFVDDDQVRSTCAEDEDLVDGDRMDSGTRAAAGGETDDYRNDIGVHYWKYLAVKLQDSPSPLFSNFAPDDASPAWIYTHTSQSPRYASHFSANSQMFSYAPMLCLLSDTHFANITPDYCNGR